MPDTPFNSIKYKTGDIILFHAYNNINPVFIGSFWGHIGIVFVDPDVANAKPLIFEAARTSQMKNCSDTNRHGIMITDLETRLKKYPGLLACKILNRPVNPGLVRGFVDFMIYAKKNMHYNENIFHNVVKKKSGHGFNHGTNCGEIVVLSLVKLGLLPENILKSNTSHHLLYAARLKTLQNNYYHRPVELTFDPF